MEFRLLGPVEAASEQGPVGLGRRRERALLALLLLEVGRPVPIERLIELLFDETGHSDPRKAIQVDVSRLRRTLAGVAEEDRVRLVSDSSGYAIHADPASVDVHRFAELVERARSAVDPVERAETLRSALALWRGSPIPDLGDTTGVAPIRARLEQLRLEAVELRVESDLEMGRHTELVAELADLNARHPTSERLLRARMLALYRSGRKRDALDLYQQAAGRLADELGLDPGPEVRDLYTALLRDDPELGAPEPAVPPQPPQVRPAQLPADLPAFTGRDDELASLLARCRLPHQTVVIVAVDGMAGVGKTALAVHAAHRLAADYPDGQLFVDLNGHTEGVEPVGPGAALARLLRSLGISDAQIPTDTEERAALYRSVLADKRVLILLDNAASEDQVRRLLPATTGCLGLVTSRQQLAGLDEAVPVTLDVLPSPDATALLARVAGPELIADEPDHVVRQVVDLCGRLPLAIRIAAARLRTRSSWTVADLLGRLRDEHHRLGELEVGDRDVAGAFALSYRQLPPAHQRMFRLLGLHPGSDIDTTASAALLECAAPEADRILGDLVDVHLITEPRPGRYGFHDLLRSYAVQRADAEEAAAARTVATGRLFEHFLRGAAISMDVLYPGEASRRPDRGADTLARLGRVEAEDWLDAELANLIAVGLTAHRLGHGSRAVRLVTTIRRHLWVRGRLDDAVKLHTLSRETAHALDDVLGEIRALDGLGRVHEVRGRIELADESFRVALDLAREKDDQLAMVDALSGLGRVSHRRGEHDLAVDYFTRSLDLSNEIDDRRGEQDALSGLGSVYFTQRDDRAVECFQRSLELARLAGDRGGELTKLVGLGVLHLRQDDLETAETFLRQALTVSREIGHRIGELQALNGLGDVLRCSQRYDDAAEAYREMANLARTVGNPNYQFEGQHGLAQTLLVIGDASQALTLQQGALKLAIELGQPFDQAIAHEGIADCLYDLGREDEARGHWRHALETFTELAVPDADRVRDRLAALDQGTPTS